MTWVRCLIGWHGLKAFQQDGKTVHYCPGCHRRLGWHGKVLKDDKGNDLWLTPRERYSLMEESCDDR